MPTKLPRMTVVLSQEQFDILTRMGQLQHRSASSFVRELVDAAMPALRAMQPILEAREQKLAEQPEALQRAAQGLLDTLNGIDPNQLSLLGITEADFTDLATAASPLGDERDPEGDDPADRSGSDARTVVPLRTASHRRGKR